MYPSDCVASLAMTVGCHCEERSDDAISGRLVRAERPMQIRDVKVYVLEAALAEPFAYSQAWYAWRGACLVEIVGEDGLSGWGEAVGPARLTAPIGEYYKPLLIGADALATEAIWQSLYNRRRDHGHQGLAGGACVSGEIAL